MLRFHELILKKLLILFLFLFLSIGGIVYHWIEDFYISSVQTSLEQNIDLISYQIESNKNLDKLASEIKTNLNMRLTIVSNDGKVIAESHFDKETMDNHKYRKEIMDSDFENFGFIIRHSKTIDKDLIYVAKQYQLDNSVIYIRLAKELESIHEQIYSLGFKIIGVLAIFFIAVFITTYKISLQVQEETKRIVKFLKSLTKKKKENYIDSYFSQEFSQITKLLTKVSQILIKQDKQKAKYTAKLQASNNQKDDIISAISHEFKNPIAIINGYAQTLLEDENLNKNIQTKFLTKIYKNGNRLNELIDTLRLSTKLEGGKQTLQIADINLVELLKDVVENIKLTYKNREIKIISKESMIIKADEMLFSIVLINIIENGCKYSEDEIIIKLDEKSISVIDSGIGISGENISKITDKFYRVSSNSWNNSLGLGLFLVNNIIELHHFKLSIESVENEGSTFKIEF
ncbi:MAG: sensor histidine kinase [Campylobacterales bacterium]|nr:sensor histidine kinase [Campylobacterales bacterium]